jgi:hypothetical protein
VQSLVMTLFILSAVLCFGTWYWGSLDNRAPAPAPWTASWIMHNAMLPVGGGSAVLALVFLLVWSFNDGPTIVNWAIGPLAPLFLIAAVVALISRIRLGGA